MHQLAGEPAVGVLPEVAVLQQQRHLKRRRLGKVELTLALVADEPQAGKARVHGQLGHAHDVVVVPQQRRPLVHWVVADGVLAGSKDVLRPAIVRGGGHGAVQMDDRVAAQRGGIRIGRATAQTGQALDGDAVTVGLCGGERDSDRIQLVDLVAPEDPHRPATLGLDRRSWNPAVVRPHP